MRTRFRLLYRGERDTYFCFDNVTRKRTSLHTNDRDAAEQIVLAKNQSLRQPTLNLHIAKAYLAGTDSGADKRTWQQALNALIDTQHGSTQERWLRAAKDAALDELRNKTIIETNAECLLAALKAGTVSTNVHLRKLHNFCLAMSWLPWPLIPKRLWPDIIFKPKRAIRLEEHRLIVAREKNQERRDFYELCWHLGGSQADIANLQTEDIDWRGLEFPEEKFNQLMGVERDLWRQELTGHDALFGQLYDKLPKEFIFIRELILSSLWRAPEHWGLAHE